jgi:hypothetical protein
MAIDNSLRRWQFLQHISAPAGYACLFNPSDESFMGIFSEQTALKTMEIQRDLTLSGTFIDSPTPDAIREGGYVIRFDWTSDNTNSQDSSRASIASSLRSDRNTIELPSGWEAVVVGNIPDDAVVFDNPPFTASQGCTLTLPAFPSYSIPDDESENIRSIIAGGILYSGYAMPYNETIVYQLTVEAMAQGTSGKTMTLEQMYAIERQQILEQLWADDAVVVHLLEELARDYRRSR